MEIQCLTPAHLPRMEALLRQNLAEARQALPFLPSSPLPDLRPLTENGLGVAALEGERLLGYWGCLPPWEHAFGTAARGIFSPLHGHGAVSENRQRIYQHMYQAAAERWVARGITYHAISLFAPDEAASQGLFSYNFGRRCADAMCPLEETPVPDGDYRELYARERSWIVPLQKELDGHLSQSPCFMRREEQTPQVPLSGEYPRYFAAMVQGKAVAFLAVAPGGETFLADDPRVLNLHGAYCLPELRGQGIMDGLLAFVKNRLFREGVAWLGVDYETMNPNANAYWPKHFSPYTFSLTRRVDEGILSES